MRLKNIVRGPHGLGTSLLALSFALAGCTGMVSGNQMDGAGAASNGGGAGSGSTGGGPPGAAPDPGFTQMRLLNISEYNSTVTDVLGTTLQPASTAANWRHGESEGFDNIAASLSLSDAQIQLYLQAAQDLSDAVFASEALRARVVTCAVADDTACVNGIINRTGLRLLRRPLLESEVTTYAKAYTFARSKNEDHNGAIKHVLWSMLASAEFLYRMEFDGAEAGKHPVSGYELASRLSYFLWSSAPDDALLAAAPTLSDDAVLSATVDRLLADAKSARFIDNFAGQWLGVRRALEHPVAADIYPAWNRQIATAAAGEMSAYFTEFLRNDRPWQEFMTADVNFVNAPLAAFYGIPNITGDALQRVEYAGDERKGYLGLVGFLAESSVDRRSSPTLRGKAVLDSLLCDPPPPAPGDAGKLEDTGDPTNLNIRDALAAHRVRVNCGACHNAMDPFGLALENYDGIGKPRTTYPNGEPIDISTELPKSTSFPDGLKFTGMAGAQDAIVKDPRFTVCLTRKLFTFGLGRKLTEDDIASSKLLTAQAGQGITIKQAIRTLALAEPFRFRNAAKAAQ